MKAAAFDWPAVPMLQGELRQAWVYRQLRQAILRKTVAPGYRLPSSRLLAQRLSVSRSTVEVAFDQLRAEGYISGVAGSGTYVSDSLPDRYLVPEANSCMSMPVAPPVPADRTRPNPDTVVRASRVNTAFSARVADGELFPIASWRRRLVAAARRSVLPSDEENDVLGTKALRTEVARYVRAARGIACDAGQIVIVSGIRQSLDLCGRVLAPGQDVLVEDPGYAQVLEIFQPYARCIVPIPVDASGLPDALARCHPNAKLVHITPAHQSPTGSVMPVARRLALLAWAQEQDAWLLEDDYDSEFNYRSAPLPAIKSLDEADRVIHCGSFNKTMFADLRIGYLVVPKSLVATFTQALRVVGRSVGLLEQRALASFIHDGDLARHIRRARAVYAARRERVLAALREAISPSPLRTTGEHGGFHFVWWLPPDIAAATLIAQAQRHGLVLEDVASFCRDAVVAPGVLIGDSAVGDDAMDDCLQRLCSAISAARSTHETCDRQESACFDGSSPVTGSCFTLR